MESVGADKTKTKSVQTQLIGAVNCLLDSLQDKDESVRNASEASLGKVAEKHPNEVLMTICEYRQKHQKLPDLQVATLLRIIELITFSNTSKLTEVIIEKISDMCVMELVKIADLCTAIQRPALESLVSLGRHNCDIVMESLMKQLQHGQVTHFMILHCMGTLATANPIEVVHFMKQIFAIVLPTLDSIKQDYVKQAHAFAIGRFCEALTENLEALPEEPEEWPDEFSTEISISYEVFFQNWLHQSREPKVCADILYALSQMFPLMPYDKINDQIQKVIPFCLSLFRRSIDRISITQFLASVLKTSQKHYPKELSNLSHTLIVSLFDLVCVNPDYEKPQTVKGHYEVLRCFDLLAETYGNNILDMLLVQLRSNNERERVKSLLVLTHLTNTSDGLVSKKSKEFIEILKHMVHTEKALKMKMVLLKTIVAFAQKGFIKEKDFVKFIVRHCCQYNKILSEFGTADEYGDFVQACNNSLFILATTVGTIDDLLKRELLQYYLMQDYTDACNTIAKSLASLFGKNPEVNVEENLPDINAPEEISTTDLPSAEAVFARSLALIGNWKESKRTGNILLFLKNYAVVINKHLQPLWDEKIPELLTILNSKDFRDFLDAFYPFLMATIKDIDEPKFSEHLVHRLTDQLSLYVAPTQPTEFKIPILVNERGMLLKVLGVCLCYVTDPVLVESKIDLIINTAKLEKLEKIITEPDTPLTPAAIAMGFISKNHLDILLKKLNTLSHEEGRRKSHAGFFSGLNFMKDTHKDADIYKVKLLVIESYGFIIRNAPQDAILKNVETTIVSNLCQELAEAKENYLKDIILSSLLTICQQILNNDTNYQLKSRNEILHLILKIPIDGPDNLPLLPTILRLSTALIKIQNETNEIDEPTEFLEITCRNFFTSAQELKTKFDSIEDDERNSYLAKCLNESLPEVNAFVRAILEQNPSPACLDDILSILDKWTKDKNCQVRICAANVTNCVLEVYMKSMKLGCEAPSKFNQTGLMLGKIVPRCIDSNATVRQISVDILRKILEISCIYETLTIPDNDTDWIKELIQIRGEIITDDPNEIYRLADEIGKTIGARLTNFQYVHFCKTLLYGLNDPEQSSATGASVVLKFFIQYKGSELFHAISDLIKECLDAIRKCEWQRAQIGVLKAIVALAKHHPKLACNEMLTHHLPLEFPIVQFWRNLAMDPELSGIVIDNFLSTLTTSCLYEPVEGKHSDGQKVATIQPFAIICALQEILPSQDIRGELKNRFADIFTMLLTSLATYTNIIAPSTPKPGTPTSGQPPKGSSSHKFGFIPNKDAIKMNPCEIVLETFIAFLTCLEMGQVASALTVCPNLETCSDLGNFIETMTPLAVALANELNINSSAMKQVITSLSKYIPSPYDHQRIAAVSFYSQLVPLKPCGEIASVIMLHLHSSLNDPNAVVRGCCIRGLAFVGNLTDHDIDKYSEMCLAALLKGLDDPNSSALINIPLESMRGLSKIMISLPNAKIEMFQISLAIRIKPFFENPSTEIREAAIYLLGDLCESKLQSKKSSSTKEDELSEPLKEQLFANFFPLLLHLSEYDQIIVRASKITLKKVCALLNTPKINLMVQNHLLEHGQLHYEIFIEDFVKIVDDELPDSITDFIDTCMPFLKSSWPEIRGNAAIIIGMLHNYNKTNQQNLDQISHKLSHLLKDENNSVKVKAATALGFLFGDI